jgi:O-antigen/teichoic acid export membrane protein
VGAVVVVIGSLGMLYGTSAGAVDTALVMSGHSVLSMLNSIAVLVLNVVLNLLLIPAYGITGAAVAWAATVVVRNVLAQVQVKRLDGLRLYGVASAWAAACVLVVYAPTLLALRLWGSAPVVVSIAVILVSTGIYAWAAFRVPALHLDDLVRSITRDRWGRSPTTADDGRGEDDHGAQR